MKEEESVDISCWVLIGAFLCVAVCVVYLWLKSRKVNRKLDKEMPPIKFKKGDPFELGKDGWSVPYDEAKKLLDEEE
jgi:hypothetical protein